jgi:glycosyltransferase involved in cell wall biosynthesis
MQSGTGKLNIIHLRSSNFYGGPERQLHYHARLARQAGYGITIASFSESGSAPAFLKVIGDDGVNTHCFMVKNAYDPKSFRLVKKYLAQNGVDILCTHDYRSQVIGFFATRGTRVKWLAFSRGTTTENLKVRVYQEIEGFVIRFADHVVAVSGSQKQKLMRLRVAETKISVVRNAIDVRLREQVEPVDLRRRYGFPDDSIVCVSAGRFSPEKGQAYLIRAARRVLNVNGRLRFVLFGDGPEWGSANALISELKLHGMVICPGFDKNVLGCISGSDFLVNPSLSEGLPNVVLEGVILKVPIVATAVGGVPEILRHQESGLLVPPGDEEALADTILELLANWPRREAMTMAALAAIEGSFSFETQMKCLETIYLSLMGNRSTAV